jgi:hypothetical protein
MYYRQMGASIDVVGARMKAIHATYREMSI